MMMMMMMMIRIIKIIVIMMVIIMIIKTKIEWGSNMLWVSSCLLGYRYRLVTRSNSMKPEGLHGEFEHVPTSIYIPTDTLKWYLITYIYICDR
jgi:hypothetical protein